MPMMTYFPSAGIAAIQTAATSIRRNSLDGSGSLSAARPPHTLPSAIAIMMVPIIIVHTIWDDEK